MQLKAADSNQRQINLYVVKKRKLCPLIEIDLLSQKTMIRITINDIILKLLRTEVHIFRVTLKILKNFTA